MMRSMWSGVSGLKTHQTKMDVIGNNIANVNTTAYKSSSVNFSELLYQTTSKASGPNATTGKAGINPRQIGLGVQSAAINTAITTGGAAQTTGNPFDVRIKGDSFFIVNGGGGNVFTRDGSFYIDPAGNLAMTSNGYNVMGWNVDADGQIHKDTVQALRVMNSANLVYEPEATTEAYVDGILDKNEPDAKTTAGRTLQLSFYDQLGYSYTAKFAIHATQTKGQYVVELADIIDSTGESLVDVYGVNDISDIASFGQDIEDSITELKKLVEGAHYDAAGADGKKYTMERRYDALFSDWAEQRLSGVEYDRLPSLIGGNAPAAGECAAGTAVTVKGNGTITRSKLTQEPYSLIFVEATGTVPAHYEKGGKALYASDPADANYPFSADDWDTALDKNSGTVKGIKINADGDITFDVESTFHTGESSIYDTTNGFVAYITQEEAYGVDPSKEPEFDISTDGKQAQVTITTVYHGNRLTFNTDTGKFTSVGSNNGNSVVLDFNTNANGAGGSTSLGNFGDISIDFSNVLWWDNGGASTISATPGSAGTDGREKGLNAGYPPGAMDGISISENGEIWGSYDNGMIKLLGQIAVAKFANAAGLEKVGENLYGATLNSGDFDGVGVDITADGEGGMVSGSLEMSNVDLSQEFTEMITTQRGFQANSRIITVSDTLLEELVNLKR